MKDRPVPWLTRVRATNFKSISACDVTLGPLTVLIGPNGTGKSNFLDILAFIAEAVATTPYQAIDARGGLCEILRRVPKPANSFSVKIDVVLPWGLESEQWAQGTYGFEIAYARRRGRLPLEVVREECTLASKQPGAAAFRVRYGSVTGDLAQAGEEKIRSDRLHLPTAAARATFAPLFDAIVGMKFYNLDPTTMRLPQPEAEGRTLGRRGEHLADVLGTLGTDYPEIKQRLDTYMSVVAPGVEGIDRVFAGTYVTVEMRQNTGPEGTAVTFRPDAMSDGTIRAAGVLAALFQSYALEEQIALVGIEEPELALHPAASGALLDALTEASERVQVVVTSQSSDLLDREDVDPAMVRAVIMQDGHTIIGGLDAASRLTVGEGHFTLGELMRANQLSPELGDDPDTRPVAA